jgi:hypothetical protein
MGTIDKYGSATGEDALGNCQNDSITRYSPFHHGGEYLDYRMNPERYDAIQERMREHGVPSGAVGTHEYPNGITDQELQREYDRASQEVGRERALPVPDLSIPGGANPGYPLIIDPDYLPPGAA